MIVIQASDKTSDLDLRPQIEDEEIRKSGVRSLMSYVCILDLLSEIWKSGDLMSVNLGFMLPLDFDILRLNMLRNGDDENY